METGVQLLGSCRRLLRAVSMIERYGDGSGIVMRAARLRLVGRQCSRTVLVLFLAMQYFLLYPVFLVWSDLRDVAVAIVLSK